MGAGERASSLENLDLVQRLVEKVLVVLDYLDANVRPVGEVDAL